MAKVYVFRTDGKVLIGTMKEGTTVVCMENLRDVTACPKKDLDLVPSDVLRFCKEKKQKFLYQNDDGDWEAVQ